jgi:hypothetical protein
LTSLPSFESMEHCTRTKRCQVGEATELGQRKWRGEKAKCGSGVCLMFMFVGGGWWMVDGNYGNIDRYAALSDKSRNTVKW